MSSQKSVTPSTKALEESVLQAKSRGLPPVHLWSPPFTGDMDMRIARDGTWYHEGSPIRRFELARLFSTILIFEDGKYFLVTPAEKLGIIVDDAPFVAVDFDTAGEGQDLCVIFETNMGDRVVAGPDNPIRVVQNPDTGEPSPYVHVRSGLEALIDRKSFYRLVEMGVEHKAGFGVWSDGVFFEFMPAGDL